MTTRPRDRAPEQPIAAAAGRPMTDEEVAQALSEPEAPPPPSGTGQTEGRSVVARLVDVMAEVGAIAKTRQVTEGPARYAYRGIEDVQAALQGLLVKHRVLILPETLERIDHPERTTKSGTAMFACALHVRFTARGPAGDSVSWDAWGEGADTGDKASGKAHSMAYKTAMLEAFCVPTERDSDDGDRTSPEESFTDAQRERARAALRALLAATDEQQLATIRFAAAEERLLGVPVPVDPDGDPGYLTTLGEAFDGQRVLLRRAARRAAAEGNGAPQGDSGAGGAGGQQA